MDAVAHADGNAFGDVDVVGDQQGLAVADIDDETLVTGIVVVITQEAADEACDFDPPPIVLLREADLQLAVSGTIVISTRRFACIPVAVLLSATG
jgi:hypothetical protein